MVNFWTHISAVSLTQERRHGSLEPPGLPARDSWVPDESRNLLIQGHHGEAAASSSATPTDELFGRDSMVTGPPAMEAEKSGWQNRCIHLCALYNTGRREELHRLMNKFGDHYNARTQRIFLESAIQRHGDYGPWMLGYRW